MYGKTAATNLLKVFTKCISAKGNDEEEDKSADEEEEDVASEGVETDNKSKDSAKENAKTLANIADDSNGIVAFLQSSAVKSPRINAAPLLLCADKCVRVWIRRWSGNNLSPPTNGPQKHTGLA